MTGPEHYREAEKFLALASDMIRGDHGEAEILAEAQVHATLALAAATAMAGLENIPYRDAEAWQDAAAHLASPSQGGEPA